MDSSEAFASYVHANVVQYSLKKQVKDGSIALVNLV